MKPASTYEEFADALGAAYAGLSPQQRVIAQFVIEHPDDFALGTAATVAEAAGVQPSALVRFANAMKFAGFTDLQRLFRDRLRQQAGTYRERIGAMKSPTADRADATQLLSSFVELGISELHRLEQRVPDAALRQAAQMLCAAHRVHLLAQRRAFPVAAYLAYALGQLDLPVQLHDGVGGMLGESLRLIGTDELLLVTSFKDYSAEVVEAALMARERGVQVIAITDVALSPLKPAAHVCLEIGAGAPSPVRSLVAPMCLAQTLVVCAGQCLVEPRPKRRRPR
jgi:DNA-binding MurR/RpiR family transcriptional regulator